MSLQRGVWLVEPGVGWAEVPRWVAPPPRSRTRSEEDGVSHMVGTATFALLQFWLNRRWVDVGFARSMWCKRGLHEYGRARGLTTWNVLVDGPLWLAPQ